MPGCYVLKETIGVESVLWPSLISIFMDYFIIFLLESDFNVALSYLLPWGQQDEKYSMLSFLFNNRNWIFCL